MLKTETLRGSQLRNIRGEVQIPFIFQKDFNIPNFTQAQFLTSISWVGGFPLELRRQARSSNKFDTP